VITGLNNLLLLILSIKFKLLLLIGRELFNIYLFIYLLFWLIKCNFLFRFHKIIWGSYGNNPAGIIVGGCEDGTIKIYSAAKLLARESNCLISSPHRHSGPVRAIDFNPFREDNQLATGATESEIHIWDINTNVPTPLSSRNQSSEDVQHIAWNKQGLCRIIVEESLH